MSTEQTNESRYSKGDIVVIKVNGIERRRHIYEDPYWEELNFSGDPKLSTWKYPVDYKLGWTSDGVVTEGQIIRKSVSGPPSNGGDDHLLFE
tara:strand:- start:173 stop:448 length:276 start_codon:yes stop_codon:yes gene_type:complete